MEKVDLTLGRQDKLSVASRACRHRAGLSRAEFWCDGRGKGILLGVLAEP